jgi:DNA-binding NarL/FixJ family response regulator
MAPTVVLADDHPLYREGLRNVLEGSGQFEVVAEAASSDEAIEKIELHRPRLVVADLALGKTSGHSIISYVQLRHPEIRVLVLSMSTDQRDVRTAISAGAAGYITKMADHDELLSALTLVSQGGSYIAAQLVEPTTKSKLPVLTRREEILVALLLTGLSAQECALKLDISPNTIKAHLRSIYRKTDSSNLSQLLIKSQNSGLISWSLVESVREGLTTGNISWK